MVGKLGARGSFLAVLCLRESGVWPLLTGHLQQDGQRDAAELSPVTAAGEDRS